jgi:hypothetical protein
MAAAVPASVGAVRRLPHLSEYVMKAGVAQEGSSEARLLLGLRFPLDIQSAPDHFWPLEEYV